MLTSYVRTPCLFLCCSAPSYPSSVSANLRFSFDANLGPPTHARSLARLFFLRSVVGANFVSLGTGKERTRREESAEGTEEEADPAEVAPLYRRERIK